MQMRGSSRATFTGQVRGIRGLHDGTHILVRARGLLGDASQVRRLTGMSPRCMPKVAACVSVKHLPYLLDFHVVIPR